MGHTQLPHTVTHTQRGGRVVLTRCQERSKTLMWVPQLQRVPRQMKKEDSLDALDGLAAPQMTTANQWNRQRGVLGREVGRLPRSMISPRISPRTYSPPLDG